MSPAQAVMTPERTHAIPRLGLKDGKSSALLLPLPWSHRDTGNGSEGNQLGFPDNVTGVGMLTAAKLWLKLHPFKRRCLLHGNNPKAGLSLLCMVVRVGRGNDRAQGFRHQKVTALIDRNGLSKSLSQS